MMFGCFGWNPQGAPPTFKIFFGDEGSCLAVLDGTLCLAAANSGDERQHWIKDVRFSRVIKDEQDNPVFSLVNKATGLAIQHSLGPCHPVRLAQFNPNYFDETVMWTESADLSKDFGYIRMMHNADLIMSLSEGGDLVLSYGAGCGSWKIVPWSKQAYVDELESQPTSRIYCKANESLSVTIRDGAICLAPTDGQDKYQHWIEDKRPGRMIKDKEGCRAFVLINKATGEAIAGYVSRYMGCPLKLKLYNPNYLDKTVLWTKSIDVEHGFLCIRMVDDISFNFDAFQGGKGHGRACDGTSIVLSLWRKDDSLQWNIAPWHTCTGAAAITTLI